MWRLQCFCFADTFSSLVHAIFCARRLLSVQLQQPNSRHSPPLQQGKPDVRRPACTHTCPRLNRGSCDVGATCSWNSDTASVHLFVCRLCKPHYLYQLHHIRIVKPLWDHGALGETSKCFTDSADFIAPHTQSRHPWKKKRAQYCFMMTYNPAVWILGPWVKRCLIASLSFPPCHKQLPHEKYIFCSGQPSSPVHPTSSRSPLPLCPARSHPSHLFFIFAQNEKWLPWQQSLTHLG